MIENGRKVPLSVWITLGVLTAGMIASYARMEARVGFIDDANAAEQQQLEQIDDRVEDMAREQTAIQKDIEFIRKDAQKLERKVDGLDGKLDTILERLPRPQ